MEKSIYKGIHMAYRQNQNGIVKLQSLKSPKRVWLFVNVLSEEKQGNWADYQCSVVKTLGEKYRLKVGLASIQG